VEHEVHGKLILTQRRRDAKPQEKEERSGKKSFTTDFAENTDGVVAGKE